MAFLQIKNEKLLVVHVVGFSTIHLNFKHKQWVLVPEFRLFEMIYVKKLTEFTAKSFRVLCNPIVKVIRKLNVIWSSNKNLPLYFRRQIVGLKK